MQDLALATTRPEHHMDHHNPQALRTQSRQGLKVYLNRRLFASFTTSKARTKEVEVDMKAVHNWFSGNERVKEIEPRDLGGVDGYPADDIVILAVGSKLKKLMNALINETKGARFPW